MIIVWLAALSASIVVALLVALLALVARARPPQPPVLLRFAATLWVGNFILDLAILYFQQPALTGPYWGMQWLLWPLLLSGIFALFGTSFGQMRRALDSFTEQMNGSGAPALNGFRPRERRPRVVADKAPARAPAASGAAGIAAIALVFVVALVINGLITVGTTWGNGNAKALAAIPQMVSEPANKPLPPTDVNHIVLVTQGVAAYLGQQVLAANGQNLGSLYHTEQSQYTLQSVNHHLYWIAPLVYNNVWANIGKQQSPGYVVVDAEDPNTTPILRTGYHLRYLPGALFNYDLLRHVYLSGYTNGNLADPTLEVNDQWQPYYTISLMQPTRGFTGEVLRTVLLVDPQSGAITAYAPGAVPTWVDRVMPGWVVQEYLTWWGEYTHAPWFNPSGANQQVPAGDMQLLYNTAGTPVWLQLMSSSSAADESSTGVVLFDTRDGTGHFYPLAGLGVATNVTQTFTNNPQNIRAYDVGSVQLYSIYGEPTWVATFVRNVQNGQAFQAIGIVDARHLTGANVIMAPTKGAALATYSQWLADHSSTGGGVSPTGHEVTVQGTIARISAATEQSNTVYYLLLTGQSRIYQAGVQLSAELPLAQPGDQVRLIYLDTGLGIVTLTGFTDQSIPLSAAPGAP